MSGPVVSTQSGREALRGVEVLAFDLIFEVLTSQQLAELLTAPLERAAAKGERDLAQRLVRAGAGIGNALHEAIRGGHGEIASDLVDGGAGLDTIEITNAGDTPLHVAARKGEAEIAELLLLKGADKDALNTVGETPLYVAACSRHSAIALALLAAGADASLRCGHLKARVIHVAARAGSIEILRAVIERGMDVDVVDTRNRTALHYASRCNNAGCIDVLLEAGANIDARENLGFTPLHDASDTVSHEALLCLLKHGATVNAQVDYDLETPLMYAVMHAGTQQGAYRVVDSLLRAGADETMVDNKGRTAVDSIGFFFVGKEDHLADDIERVRELLANAPADRVWRRRGYLVLCRAHPERLQQVQATSSDHHADTARGSRSCAKVARVGEVGGDSGVDESIGGDWTVVVSKVLLLQEEGIFRTIVGYL
eukprot:g15024.t1